MLVAVPSESDEGLESPVAEHFGRCPFFTMVEIENGEIGAVSSLSNPFYASHSPGEVPMLLERSGARVILAGGMGRRAMALFSEFGIESSTGASGTVGQTVRAFLQGNLRGGSPCPGGSGHAHDH
ncbi:NifB/NifX family molybdenum-iron cluster-binding protein [Candidatus Fermentibacterales bacterium]|nr:NifB/NifX family molybdenum-iron cluster-binding protein [Candidatus Fermentibacterales bacterium]